jgi:hypothetical protein
VAGGLARDVQVVLDRYGDTEQGPTLAGPQSGQRAVGLRQSRLGPHRHKGAQPRIELVDPVQIELGQLARGQLALTQQVGQLGQASEGEVAVGVWAPRGRGRLRGRGRRVLV